MTVRTIARTILPILLLLTLSSVAQDTKENGEFKLAQGLYNDGLYAQAEDQLRSFIDRYPATSLGVEARFTLGLVQLRLKKWRDARNTFQDFALRFPDNPKSADAWWNLGDCFVAERNYAEAASAFSRLKTFHPKNKRAPEALLEASKYFLKAGDTDNASLVLNAIMLEYPQSDASREAAYSIGNIAVASGDYERALREFTRVLNTNVQPALKARATVAIGGVHALLGNPAEAERKYREVLTLYAKTDAVFEAWVRLGDLQRMQNKENDAALSYETVSKNSAAPAALRFEAAMGAAENALQAGRFSDAARQYDALFATYKEQAFDAPVYRRAALASRKAGNFVASGAYLAQLYNDTLIAIDRRALLVEMAQDAREGKKSALAIQYLRAYLDRYPGDDGAPYALLGIAEIQERDYRNYGRAAELYGEILNRYAASAVADRAQLGRARAFEAQGKFVDAIEAYEQLLVQFPASGMAGASAMRLVELRRFRPVVTPEGIASLASALSAAQEKGGQGTVDLLLASVYMDQLKDYGAAGKAYTAAISKGVTGEDAQRAAYGKAISSLRLAQKNEGGKTEAEQLLIAFVQQYATGALHDAAAYELYLLRTEGQGHLAVLDAGAKFLASKSVAHAPEVRAAFARALVDAGRDKEAEQECSGILAESKDPAAVAAAYFQRGRTRVSLKNFAAAADDFRACDREAPNGPDAAAALYALGNALARTGLYAQAATVFESVTDRFRYSPLADSANIALLRTLADGGQVNRAVARAQQFLRAMEGNPFLARADVQEYLYQDAVLLARAKNPVAAKAALQRYATEYPDGGHIGDVNFALGQMYKDEGKTALATTYLQKAAALNAGGAASQQVADLLLDDGRYDDAIREYESIAVKAPTKIERSYALSRVVIALYRADRIAEAQKKAADFKLSYPEADAATAEFEVERGRQLFRQKKFKEALGVFEDVADAKDPDAAALGLLWVSRTHEAQNLDQKAAEELTELLKKYPKSSAALEASMTLGRMALRAERYDVAGEAFKSIVEAPKPPRALLREALDGLIKCFDQTNTYAGAAEMTKRFITLFPNDLTVFRKKVNLGVYYQQQGYFEQAITHFENLLGQAGAEDQAEIRFSIAECYLGKGDYAQAASEALKVKYLVMQKTEIDWTASAYDLAARAYEKLGKKDLAIEQYQIIIDTPGLDPRYKDGARKRIDEIRGQMNK